MKETNVLMSSKRKMGNLQPHKRNYCLILSIILNIVLLVLLTFRSDNEIISTEFTSKAKVDSIPFYTDSACLNEAGSFPKDSCTNVFLNVYATASCKNGVLTGTDYGMDMTCRVTGKVTALAPGKGCRQVQTDLGTYYVKYECV